MSQSANFCWSLCLLSLAVSHVFGQSASGLISTQEARQQGLERMWFAQVEVDTGRGRVTHLTQHVSSTQAITVYEIHHDGGRIVISERDVDRFGNLLGPEAAKRMADIKVNDLTNLKQNPKLQTVTVPQITLYAITNSGALQAIDAETGRTLWKATFDHSRYPTEAAGASDEYVAAVNGSDLYLLRAATGEVVWKRKVKGAPGAGPAVSENLVFVPMVNGAMEAYEIGNTGLPPAVYRSQGRAMFQPVNTGAHVAWPTDRGHLYVTSAEQNNISFRLEANDAIASAAAVMHPGRILVASVDGFVYCVQESDGGVFWRFSSGEPILQTPVVYGDTVYAVTTDGTLFAIDSEYGQERWSAAGMSKVVGGSRDRLYALTEIGQLVILDQKTGSRLGLMAAATLDLPYANAETDRLILANSRGLVQCLREVQQEYPLIHIGLTKKEEAKPQAKPAAKPAAEEPAPATVDPFGAPAMEEPAPAAPAGDAKVDDPFGD